LSADSWRVGIKLIEAWNTKMSHIWIRGKPYTSDMNYGIWAIGQTVNCTLQDAYIFFADRGVYIETDCEGFAITNMIAFDCGWALYSKAFWTSWIVGHADVYTGGVYLEDNDHAIQGIFISAKTWAPDADWWGVKYVGGVRSKFTGNSIRINGAPGTGTSIGIYISSDRNTVVGNVIEDQDKGVHLDTTAQNNVVLGNTGQSNTTDVDNDGGASNVVDHNAFA